MNIIQSLKVPLIDVDSDIDEMIWPNRYLLASIGVWPLQPNASYSTVIFSIVRLITVIIFLTSCAVPQSFVVYIHWGNVQVLAENGMIVLGLTLALAKIFYAFIRRDDFAIAYDLMRYFWNMAKNQQERNEIVDVANHARFCTMLWSYLGIFNIFLYAGGSLGITLYNRATANGSDYDHKLPFGLWYGLDTQTSPGYQLIFTLQFLTMIMAFPTIIGLDLSAMLILMHVASQFRLISFRFTMIGQQISNGHELSSKIIYRLTKEIKSCIMHHQRVLSAFRFVEKLLGPLNFFQFILAAVEIGLVGWAIVAAGDNLADKVKFSLLLAAFTLQLLFGCWSGEVIIRESTEVGRVLLHNIPWFTLPISMQQDFKLVICRSQKQCEVTAIGLQIMSLKKMSEVFNTSLSYVTLLRNMEN